MFSLLAKRFSQFHVTPITSEILSGPRKVMLYRARQRGWLELDVILGSFADKRLATMTETEVGLFGDILSRENPDLFKYLSGQTPPSNDLKENPVFLEILKHVNVEHNSL